MRTQPRVRRGVCVTRVSLDQEFRRKEYGLTREERCRTREERCQTRDERRQTREERCQTRADD